jgi:hypothetical protein
VTVIDFGGVPPPKSEIEIEAIRDIDSFIAGKTEADLGQLFGVDAMLQANITYQTDRLIHYQKTGQAHLQLYPDYVKDGGLSMDVSIMGDIRQQGGGLRWDYGDNPYRVFCVILPRVYLDGKTRVLTHETSIGSPRTVAEALRSMHEALEKNEQILNQVLNEAMHLEPNHFLQYHDENSKYWHAIDPMYYKRFIALKPKADAVREAARRELKID